MVNVDYVVLFSHRSMLLEGYKSSSWKLHNVYLITITYSTNLTITTGMMTQLMLTQMSRYKTPTLG